jgi:hypothetical protein
MRERIKLYRIKTPQGPYQIVNPTVDDVEIIREVFAKREDKTQHERWGMTRVKAINRRQFIINYRDDLPEEMAVGYKGELYTVLEQQELGNNRKWIMLLAGTVSGDADTNGD